jgi:hypothetical protein
MGRREIVVNTLVGALLLLVFFARFAAIALVVWFAFIGLEWVFHLVLPSRTLPTEFLLFGAWTLLSLSSGIRHVRAKRWRNAFLCFVGAPLMGLAWFTPIRSSIGGNGSAMFFCIPVMMVIAIADGATLGRLQFFLAAAIAGAALAVNGGLLGNGVLSHTVANCVLAVAVLWWIVTIRGNYKSDASDQSLALPTARG